MVKYQDEIVRNMKQRVRTPQFLNRVIKVYDFTTLFSRLMMYRRAKSSLVQPKKEGEEETTILNEINAIMRNSNDILNSVDKHKSILEDCEQIVKDLNPVLAVDKSRDEKIANLEKSVSGINDSIEGLKELILGLNKKE